MSVAPHKLAAPVWLYLFCVVTPVRFMLGPLQMTGLRLFLLAMLPLLLWKLLKAKRIPSDILLLLFVGWVFMAMQVNTPGQAVEHTGITMLEMFGGYALARVYIQAHAQFQTLIKLVTTLFCCACPWRSTRQSRATPRSSNCYAPCHSSRASRQ